MPKRGAKQGKPRYTEAQRQQVIDFHNQGMSPSKICQELKGATPLRTIKQFIYDFNQDTAVQKSVKRIIEDKILDVTLASTIESIANRKRWLFDYAMKIWDKLSEEEKYTSKMFIKFIELAQKDDELLLKPLSTTSESFNISSEKSDIVQKLDEKLNQIMPKITDELN